MEPIYIRNTRDVSTGSVRLIKVDACNVWLHLAGAVFDLWKQEPVSGEYILHQSNLITPRNGLLVVGDLPVGQYKFVEKQAPQGYLIGGETEFPFVIQDQTEEAAPRLITVKNHKEVPCDCCSCRPCRCSPKEKGCGCQRQDLRYKLPDVSCHLNGKSYSEVKRYFETHS